MDRRSKIRAGSSLSMPAEAVVILSTAGEGEAPSLAEILVKERCAACVNITPVRSFYHWKGELCRNQETLMIIKTTRERAGAAMARLRELHSYELPEMLVLPVTGGYPPYLEWLSQEICP
jgi:periplasmic divalent cation tolerance protein